MAFVPGYKHDVFVTYCHNDNERMPTFETGWVTVLIQALNVKLNQELRKAEIFIDEMLCCNRGISSQLQEKLRESATLLAILSPSYLESEWCQRERTTFLAEDLKGRIDAGARVFLVERSPVEREARPRELLDLDPIRFWMPESLKGRRILCEHGDLRGCPNDEKDAYFDRLDKLALELANELRALKAATNGGPARSVADGPLIWLAEVTDDLHERREEVRRYLTQAGIGVLPEGFGWDEARRDAMKRDLSRCRLFVQLLSSVSGPPIPGIGQTKPRSQYEIARSAGAAIMQWRSPDLELAGIADPDHCSLISGNNVRAEGFEDFKRAVKDRGQQPPPHPSARRQAMVLLDSWEEDRPLAEDISNELVAAGVIVTDPDFTASRDMKPSEVRQLLEEALRDCQALIVVYGKSPTRWVREHMIESIKIASSGKQDPVAMAVYVGPPEGKPPLPVRGARINVVDGRTGLGDEQRRRLRAFASAIPAVSNA